MNLWGALLLISFAGFLVFGYKQIDLKLKGERGSWLIFALAILCLGGIALVVFQPGPVTWTIGLR
jgi:hypothetical protein